MLPLVAIKVAALICVYSAPVPLPLFSAQYLGQELGDYFTVAV